MRKVLAIIGPTASGKTRIGVETAKLLDGEIISADSRQVYKHFPIASAIPPEKERQGIPHHFMEELNLTEDFNAGDFGRLGRELIDDIFARDKQPVIVGGSGLYITSLIDGLFDDEMDAFEGEEKGNGIKDNEIRDKLYDRLKEKGKEFLYNELKEIDKIAAATMLPTNIKRVIRALEIYYATGKKISDLHKNKIEVNFETVQIGLMWDRSELYQRINDRVDEMMELGLDDEVRELKDKGFNPVEYNSLNTVGIKEVFEYLDGNITQSEMINLIKQNTRRYAKRQMTWFRKDKRIIWLNLFADSDIIAVAEEIVAIFEDYDSKS
jgi:tRNA dimethylallyltransferase